MNLNKDTQIKFSIDGVTTNYGTICGIATTGAPVIGIGYIVELEEKIEGYEYTHCVVFESMMK